MNRALLLRVMFGTQGVEGLSPVPKRVDLPVRQVGSVTCASTQIHVQENGLQQDGLSILIPSLQRAPRRAR